MLLQVIFSGLATGSIYALVALGLALIYNTTEHVNFAQGEMSMVSAFVGFTFFNMLGLSLWIAILGDHHRASGYTPGHAGSPFQYFYHYPGGIHRHEKFVRLHLEP
jgi:branched-subunit amino acid ABC-type transport system permease component